MDYDLYTWFLMIVLASFLGFLLENAWCAVRHGYIDNRNMNLPFLLGYGLAIALIYMVLGVPGELSRTGRILYFILLVLIVSVGEIVLGTCVEKICGFHYWDYTALPFHLTCYTSLFTSLGFASVIFIFMDRVFSRIMNTLSDMSSPGIRFFSIAGITLLTADFLISFRQMYKTRGFYRHWEIKRVDGHLTREIFR